MSGKGSARRPQAVDDSTVENNWNAIFAKKPQQTSDYQDILSTEDCVLAALEKITVDSDAKL
jgi:hypothetical protein